jgi:pilus assembly protein CpaB
MRAITVPVSAQTGVGGFVFPGDRVDMVLTQSVKGEDDDGPPLKASETILKNIRVLATDQSTETEHTPDGKTVVRDFRTVTLEVTPKIAEKVAVAQTIGTLSLSLRSIADNQTDLEKAIASGEVNIPEGVSKDQEESILRSALAKPRDGASSFVTGGDVSRFQRRSIPRTEPRPATSSVVAMGVGGNSGGGQTTAPVHIGPVVRVTRGKDTVAVPVGK